MTKLEEVVADLRAETEVLDGVLTGLEEQDWFRETPAVGWDIRDTVGHLADTDDLMYHSVTGGARDMMSEALEAVGGGEVSADMDTVDAFTALQVERVRKRSPQEVYAWWQESTKTLHDLISSLDPAGKYRWGPNTISPLSLASARLMETWAHSLDVHAAVEEPYEDTDRIRHIAHLGWRAIPYAFSIEKLPAPGPVRLELASPGGEIWTYGEENAPNRITGSASDWCRVAARRDRDGSAGRLRGEGPESDAVIKNARAFL